MSDLIKRLRSYAACTESDVCEAADELERMQSEARLMKSKAMLSESLIERLQMKLDALATERDHAIEQAAKNCDEVLRLREDVATLNAFIDAQLIKAARESTA